MRSIFLPVPFADPRILQHFTAEGLATRPAAIPGLDLRLDPETLRVVLAEDGGAVADGALVDPDDETTERIHFAMAAADAYPQILTGAHGEEVTAFVTDDPPPLGWGDAGQPDLLTATLAEAIGEVMSHFGRRPVEDMPVLLPGIALRALARQCGAAGHTRVELRSGLGPGDIEPITATPAYAHYFAVEAHQLRHRRFDGRSSRIVDRAVFASGDAVTVLPYDPHLDTVLLIEQFRAGPYARRDPHPWILETVAGRCGVLETPEQSARREALEEAGLTLGRLERVFGYYSSPGMAAEFITSFVGEADLDRGVGVHGLDTEDEDIRSIVVPLERALAAAASGEINTGPLLVSLLWLESNRARLAADWPSAALR